MKKILMVFALVILCVNQAQAAENPPLRIAVAANFSATAEEIAKDFWKKEGIKTEVISGSSGKLAGQIIQGAPFDVFLSADRAHLQELVRRGLVHEDALYDYAIGILVFFGQETTAERALEKQISSCRKLAIANPENAPYGKAALQTLDHLKLRDAVKERLVMGESIGQAMSFIESGAADCGFIALSQVKGVEGWDGRYVVIHETMHEKLVQSAVVLEKSSQQDAARKFIAYLLNKTTRARIIREAGYELP